MLAMLTVGTVFIKAVVPAVLVLFVALWRRYGLGGLLRFAAAALWSASYAYEDTWRTLKCSFKFHWSIAREEV